MKPQDYWEKRALKDKKISVNRGEKYINTKLRTAYGKASKELEEELAKLYKAIGEDNAKLLAAKGKLGTAAAETKGLLNRLLEEREKLEQAEASGSLPEEMIKATKEKLDAMEQLLKGKSKTGYITHLEMMKQQIDMTALSLGNRNGAEMYDFLQNQYKSDYFRKIFNTQQALSFGKDFVSPDQNAVKEIILRSYAKSNFSRRIWKNASGFAKTVKDSLTTGLIKGESIDEMTKRITSKVGVAERHARRLVRTETARIHEESIINAYRECNIERYIYMATLDRRTSEICQELDGKSFSLEEAQMGVNYPPMHPNCRSTTVADTKLLQRIARGADGKNYKVDGKLTYKEWYEGLGKDEQGRMRFENKKEKNKAKDQKEYAAFKSQLGRKMPKFSDFVSMKYLEPEGYEKIKGKYELIESAIKDFKSRVSEGKVNLAIQRNKQLEHIEGTKAFLNRQKQALERSITPQSYFFKNQDMEKILERYKGTGVFAYNPANKDVMSEYVTVEGVIGKCYNTGKGAYEDTSRICIRYTANGVHMYPVKEHMDYGAK